MIVAVDLEVFTKFEGELASIVLFRMLLVLSVDE